VGKSHEGVDEKVAQPISLGVPPRDARRELSARLENAPAEHAEALLDAYELLQQLHDQHVFEVLRGAISASGKFVESAVSAADSPGSVRAIRNAIILGKMLGSMNPELLQCFAVAVKETLGSERKAPLVEPPGLLSLLSQFRQAELRRSMALINRFLDVLGKELKHKADAGPGQ
jgi:uncharacterized protein YjgD (DUF1641 family)